MDKKPQRTIRTERRAVQ